MDINKYILSTKKTYLRFICKNFNEESQLLDLIAALLNVEFGIIEIDIQNIATKNLVKILKKVRELCSLYNTMLIVPERIDIAKIVSADGIALDENSMELSDAKKLIENSMLICFHPLTNYIENITEVDFITTDKAGNTNQLPTFIRQEYNLENILKNHHDIIAKYEYYEK